MKAWGPVLIVCAATLVIGWGTKARATSCSEESTPLRETRPWIGGGDSNPTPSIAPNGFFFLPPGEEPPEVHVDGVVVETAVRERALHNELVPTSLFPAGSTVELVDPRLDGWRLTVTDEDDEEPPKRPKVKVDPRYECRPIVWIMPPEVEDLDADVELWFARFDESPTTDTAEFVVAPDNDVMVVEGEAGEYRELFIIAVDSAGNESEVLSVELAFPLSPVGCSHTAMTESLSVRSSLALLVVLLTRLGRRRSRLR